MIVASSYVCDVCGTGYSGVDTARVYTASAYGMVESADLCPTCLTSVRAAVQAMKDEHTRAAQCVANNTTEAA